MHRARRVLAVAALAGSFSCAALRAREPAPEPPPAAPVLDPGAPAPDVAATGPGDKRVSLSDYRGKPLVLYFYPVDFGSGGTAEAEEFKSDYVKFRKPGVSGV